MLNYLGKFFLRMFEFLELLRDLIKKNVFFVWGFEYI